MCVIRAICVHRRAIASDVLVSLPTGARSAREVASINLTRGATSIRTENGQLAVYIFVDMTGRDLGGYVAEAKRAVANEIKILAWLLYQLERAV